jgi:hypothetical protein
MTWEYLTVRFERTGFLAKQLDLDAFNEKLNELGRQGWDLAAYVDPTRGATEARDVVIVFKRQR